MNPELVKFQLPTTDQFSVAVDRCPDHERLMARLGGSGSSWPRISNSSQFHTFNLRLYGFTHLNRRIAG
jgi:hypothetical protein